MTISGRYLRAHGMSASQYSLPLLGIFLVCRPTSWYINISSAHLIGKLGLMLLNIGEIVYLQPRVLISIPSFIPSPTPDRGHPA